MKISKIPIWGWSLLGIVLILGFNLVLFLPTYTTSKRGFCLTCHSQQASAEFWEKSDIHPKLDCPECHAQGNVVIPSIDIFPFQKGAPPGFSAKVDRINPNCLRCHQEVTKNKDIKFKHNPWNIKIPHQSHQELTNNSCTLCHYNIYHDRHSPPSNRPPMEICFSCHERTNTSCSQCHPKGSVQLPKTDNVSRPECNKCHRGFEKAEVKIYGIQFLHERHSYNGVDCNICHSNKQKHGEIVLKRSDCLDCHHKTIKADCSNCHQIQVKYRKGQAMGEEKAEPEPMVGIVSCESCHQNFAQGHSLAKVEKACLGCHQQGYESLPESWQSETKDNLRGTKALLALVKLQLRSTEPNLAKKFKHQMEEAKEIFELIEKDKSKGVHNFAYTQKLIAKANHNLLSIQRFLSKKGP